MMTCLLFLAIYETPQPLAKNNDAAANEDEDEQQQPKLDEQLPGHNFRGLGALAFPGAGCRQPQGFLPSGAC